MVYAVEKQLKLQMVSYYQHWQSNILKKVYFFRTLHLEINLIHKMDKKMIPQKGEGRLFIVLPTLETMLSSCDNSKMRAQGAGMEYSNFRKHCKMQTDLRIETYTKCASAFDMDVLLLHLPKGMIESLVHTTEDKDHSFFTIEKEDLIFLLNKLCHVDHKRMIQHIIFLANRIVKKTK